MSLTAVEHLQKENLDYHPDPDPDVEFGLTKLLEPQDKTQTPNGDQKVTQVISVVPSEPSVGAKETTEPSPGCVSSAPTERKAVEPPLFLFKHQPH